MMMFDELKTLYVEQVESIFNEQNFKHLQTNLDLLFEVASFSSELSTPFFESLKEVLAEKVGNYGALVNFATFLESYLKLIDKLAHTKIKANGLADYTRVLLDNKDKKFDKYIKSARETRNDTAHGNAVWKNKQTEILKRRDEILVVLIITTGFHREILQKNVENQKSSSQFDLVPYLKEIEDSFKEWKARFVALGSGEKIDLFVEETMQDDEIGSPESGNIEALRKNIADKQFMLLGEAGMGKTTTLQYFTYQDAVACRKDASLALPVYLELKWLSAESSLLKTLKDKLGEYFTDNSLEARLKQGKIALFLDALNEVNTKELEYVVQQIRRFIQEYPDVPLVISGRTEYAFELKNHKPIRIFELRKMTIAQIEQFLQRNASEFCLNLIYPLLKSSSNVQRWLSVPMYLKMLIESTEKLKQVENPQVEFDALTETTASLIEGFIRGLFEREKKKDTHFSEMAFEYFLVQIAKAILNEEESYTFTRLQLIRILKEHHNLFPDTDLAYFLTTCQGLGLLVENLSANKQVYSFAHEEYLDFFASKAFDL